LKEALVELTLGQRALKIWVFVAEPANEFILGQGVPRANDALVDVGWYVLRLGREVLWRQSLVVARRARPEDEREPSLLRGLPEAE
jgi:hypothetical protein